MAGARIVGTRIGAVPRPGQRRHPPGRARCRLARLGVGPTRRVAEHGPAPVAAEQVAGRWILDVLDLPRDAAVGFPTGAQAANTIGLLAARHHVLAAHGINVERTGLGGAPPVALIGSAEQHSSVARSARVIGLGSDAIVPVPSDSSGAMDPDAARAAILGHAGPLIVNAQAGNVNAGAFDPIDAIADAVAERRSKRDDIWLHVDGAFGLWVRASSRRAALAAGAERADSWACDAHKWLNTPYDCGISIVADRAVLAAALACGPPICRRWAKSMIPPIGFWSFALRSRSAGVGGAAVARPFGGGATRRWCV